LLFNFCKKCYLPPPLPPSIIYQDGLIKFNEFLVAISFQHKSRNEDERKAHFEKLFKCIDINNDCQISQNEFKRYFDAVFDFIGCNNESLTLNVANEKFEKYDVSKTGFLSREEFIEFCSKEDIFIKF
jgi:Ca2+-binding EF-hand superfamily protein